jgi:hypothetical protein
MRRLILIALLAAACGGGEKHATTAIAPARPPAPHRACPSATDAQGIVEASSDFGELDFTQAAVTIPTKKSAMNPPQLDNAKRLATAGWLKLDRDEVVLTKGKGDPRFNVRPNGFIDIVPIAKKKLISASNVRSTSDGCQADIKWAWVPTEVGAPFKQSDLFVPTHNATATLMWDGANWTMLRIQ